MKTIAAPKVTRVYYSTENISGEVPLVKSVSVLPGQPETLFLDGSPYLRGFGSSRVELEFEGVANDFLLLFDQRLKSTWIVESGNVSYWLDAYIESFDQTFCSVMTSKVRLIAVGPVTCYYDAPTQPVQPAIPVDVFNRKASREQAKKMSEYLRRACEDNSVHG